MTLLPRLFAAFSFLTPTACLRALHAPRLPAELNVSRPKLESAEVSGAAPTFVDAFLKETNGTRLAYVLFATRHLQNREKAYERLASAKWFCYWRSLEDSSVLALSRAEGFANHTAGRVSGGPGHVPQKDRHGHSLVIECPVPELGVEAYSLSLAAKEPYQSNTIYSRPELKVRSQELLEPGETALCTMVIQKANALHYAAQWLKYHLSLGFEQVLLYVEDPDMAWAQQAFKDFLQTGLVRLVHFYFGQLSDMQSWQLQQAQEQHCLYHGKGKVRWLGHSDVDEYFQPRGHSSLKDYLSTISDDVAAVSVRSQFWMLGETELKRARGDASALDLPCDVQCRRRGYLSERQKLILRPNKVLYMSVHTTTNIEKGSRVYSANPYLELRLNHFKTIPKPAAKLALSSPRCQEPDSNFTDFCKAVIARPLLGLDLSRARALLLKMA